MRRFEFDICISATHPAIPGHFPGQPIVPGVLLLDQILAETLKLTGLEVVQMQHMKFSSALRPDERARAVCEVEGDHATFLVSTRRHSGHIVLASGKFLMRLQSHETLD